MAPILSSNHEKDERCTPSWLAEQVYQPKRQRTIELVRQSVDVLRQEEAPISLACISARSKMLDPKGVGVSESAILNNEEARAYYQQHRTWKRQRQSPALSEESKVRKESGPITLTRDEKRVRQRYLRLSKPDLVDRLLAAERASANQEQRWLSHQDDVLTWRLRAETAEARIRSARE